MVGEDCGGALGTGGTAEGLGKIDMSVGVSQRSGRIRAQVKPPSSRAKYEREMGHLAFILLRRRGLSRPCGTRRIFVLLPGTSVPGFPLSSLRGCLRKANEAAVGTSRPSSGKPTRRRSGLTGSILLWSGGRLGPWLGRGQPGSFALHLSHLARRRWRDPRYKDVLAGRRLRPGLSP